MPKLLLPKLFLILPLIIASPAMAQTAVPCTPSADAEARGAPPSSRTAWFRCAVDEILTGVVPTETGRSVSPPSPAR